MSNNPTGSSEPLPIEQEWRRLHPFSPLLRGGLFLLVVVGIIIANLRDRVLELFFSQEVVDAFGPNEGDLIEYLARQRLLIWALVVIVVVILAIIAISWLSWRFSTFRITAEAVESKRGVLFRQHRRAPLERIQSVNLQRSLLARLVGLTEVDVQTGGQGGKVALQYLGHRDAKEVREQILLAARMSRPTNPPVAGPVATLDGGEDREQQHGQFGLAGSSNEVPASPLAVDFGGQAYPVAPGAVDARLRDLVDFDIDPSAHETGRLIKVPVGRLVASILLSTEMFVLLAVVVAIAATSIWASPFTLAGLFPVGLIFVSILISQFNKGFNFVLSRADDGVRIGAGLTATVTETIPFGRVHAIEAMQPLGWRPLGWWKVRITTAGHSASQAGQNKLQNVVLPVGDAHEVVRVFDTLLYSGEAGAEERQAALLDALVGAGDGYVRPGKRAAAVLWFAKERSGIRIEEPDEDHASLRIRRGWFTRSLLVMPLIRAQSVLLRRPPLHRWCGLALLEAHTVLGPVRMYARGIELDQARQVFDELAETVVAVQRRDADRRAAEHEEAEQQAAEHEAVGREAAAHQTVEQQAIEHPTAGGDDVERV